MLIYKKYIKYILLLLLALPCDSAFSQPTLTEKKVEDKRILFLIDFSGSMMQTWAMRDKLSVAKEVLYEIVDSLNPLGNLQMGLRVYGHQKLNIYNDCFDTKLEVPFGEHNGEQIKGKLEKLEAKGITPIAYSLEQAAKDFPDFYGKNYIIFISDGEESCNGDPCAVAKALMDKGVNLKLFIIGLSLGERAENALKCIGTFYNSKNPEDFKKIMTSIVTSIMYSTSLEVDLNNELNKPTESNVAMTFYDDESKSNNLYLYHTLNARGNPDTFRVPTMSKYNLKIHTTPPLYQSNLKFINDHHNHVNFDAAQGDLKFEYTSTTNFNNINNKIKAVVYDKQDPKALIVHTVGEKNRYLKGRYDIEILTLPRIHLRDVLIEGSKLTTIQIPTPGICTIMKNYELIGAVFYKKEDGTLEKMIDLNTNVGKETVALQEGNYCVVYRSKKINKMMKTTTKDFKVTTGASVFVTIN